ncbi:pyocin activator PrtN family protein [Pseudomonas sp. GD03860]|uniref:pyocin activator PrtN family protein n=1 Tax=Pseudomonas TaxID=286 RepID=UPI0023641666|nr:MULTISPECIES: pyocin activator PrtN family protein [Pseudomonas]MDD2056300.1 pyocin activator PrtN family protein [Pseudomonas putida]MDH0637329.1 pyocin activator PrtN family protein [Pseudomonas sp. GD03860]
MTDTLAQLRKQFPTPCPTLSAVREHYFPHIKTDRRLRELIKAKRIGLKLSKPHNSARAKPVVYLHDLADFLDTQAKQAT